MTYASSILDLIGNTPLLKLNSLSKGFKPTLLLKMESCNPGGSVKDRIGISMITSAEREGKLKPGDLIVEPTSGNTGIGLALAARLKGYRCLFVMTDKASQERVRYLKALGADVLIVSSAAKPSSPEYYFNTALRLSEELPNALMLNQYDNGANPQAHFESTGPEIWEQTNGTITHFVAGIGTGGTITGIAKFLKSKNPNIKVIAADPVGSSIKSFKEFGRLVEALPYLIEGVGQERIPGNLDLSLVDEIINVSDRDAFATARMLARNEGVFCGGSSGMNVFAALQAAQSLTTSDVVVTIIADTGERYLSKHHSDEWLAEKQLLIDSKPDVSLILSRKHSESKVPHVVWVRSNETVDEALKLMMLHGLSQLPVIDNDKVVASIRENKLMAAVIEDRSNTSGTVLNYSDPPPPVIDSHTDLDSAVKLLRDNAYVVVEEYQHQVGVLSRHDIIQYM